MLNFLLAEEGSPVLTYIIMGVLVVAIIGMFVWSSFSNKKKQKEAQDMMDNMKIGDRVKTIGGVCGFLVEVNKEENTIVLETGSGEKKSYVKFDRAAIYQTGPANPEKPAETPVVEEVKEESAPAIEEVPVEKKSKKNKKAKKEEVVTPVEEVAPAPVEEIFESEKVEKPVEEVSEENK